MNKFYEQIKNKFSGLYSSLQEKYSPIKKETSKKIGLGEAMLKDYDSLNSFEQSELEVISKEVYFPVGDSLAGTSF